MNSTLAIIQAPIMLRRVISFHVLVEGSLVGSQLIAKWTLVVEISFNVAILDMTNEVGLNELVARPAYVPAFGVNDIALDECGDA